MATAKGNQGIQKLLAAMRKLIREVNDREICNRLEILATSEKEDIPSDLLKDLLDNPLNFDANKIPEPYTQYVKHYIYMVKRENRIQQRKEQEKGRRKKRNKEDDEAEENNKDD
ncbi:MAG: hypothetical protein NZ853_05210 [Leptospiraceae bacterium]|nr:hypothetical protein [Leptospiraceae bacterium]MDW7976654.1 hypothetical protein [Leptospiraceae bacterium]